MQGKAAMKTWILVGGLFLACFVTATIWMFRPLSPQQKLDRARQLATSSPQGAFRLVQEVTATDPQMSDAKLLLSCQLLFVLNFSKSAEEAWDQIQKPDACNVEDLLATAHNALKQGDQKVAEAAFLAACRPGPHYIDALQKLIALAYERGNLAVVLDACSDLAKVSPEDPYPWLVSAGIYHENEQVPAALEAYHEALRRDPPRSEQIRIRYQIADLSLFTGDLVAARKQLDQLMRGPTPNILLLHARLLRNEGKPQAALEVLDEILAKHADSAGAWKLRGEIYLDQEQFEEAVTNLRRAVQQNTYDYQAHYKLAQALLRIGKTEEAETHLSRSRHLTNVLSEAQTLRFRIQQDPNNRQLRLRLAELSREQGDFETAEYWQKSL